MPAWGNGTPEGAAASWELVHFIRQLSKLTPRDLEEMEELNPRSIVATVSSHAAPFTASQIDLGKATEAAPKK